MFAILKRKPRKSSKNELLTVQLGTRAEREEAEAVSITPSVIT